MASPSTLGHALDPLEHLFTRHELVDLRPSIPVRTLHLVEVLLGELQREVVLPVVTQPTVWEALSRLESCQDFAATVVTAIDRSLVLPATRARLSPDVIDVQTAAIAHRVAERAGTRLGRAHAEILRSAITRLAAGLRETWRVLDAAARLPVDAARLLLARGSTLLLVERSVRAEVLFWVCQMGVEEPDFDAVVPAVLRGIIESFWESVDGRTLVGAEWARDCFDSALGVHLALDPALEAAATRTLDPSARFIALTTEWRWATGHLSAPPRILAHPAYRAICSMGWPALPLILRELSTASGDIWSPALSTITGESPPMDPARHGDVDSVTQAWLDLARDRGWLP